MNLRTTSSILNLGAIFNKRLTWRQHLQEVALRCKKNLNNLKALTHSKVCQNTQDLLRVYRALIRSIMDYDSVSPSVKCILDCIQYEALRIFAHAKQGTSLKTQQVKFGEMPLELRREMLSIRLRKYQIPQWKRDWLTAGSFELCKMSNSKKPFGLRTQNLPGVIDQNLESSTKPPNVPFWTWHPPHVSTELNTSMSKQENIAALRQYSLEMIHSKWSNYLHIQMVPKRQQKAW